MNQPGSSGGLSYDLWPEVDADLQAAYQRNIAAGAAAPEVVAASGLAAAAAVQQDPDPTTPDHPFGSPEFHTTLTEWRNRAVAVYSRLGIPVPELADPMFEDVDWGRLEKSYSAMKRLGWSPDLIMCAVGLPVSDWKDIYACLPEDKRCNLNVTSVPGESWQKLDQSVQGETRWQFSIIAGTLKPVVTGVSHDLKKAIPDHAATHINGVFTPEVGIIHPEPPDENYPTVSEYLMLQAERAMFSESLVDETANTWLRGTFSGGRAPIGYFRLPIMNLQAAGVAMSWASADSVKREIGVRPTVRELGKASIPAQN